MENGFRKCDKHHIFGLAPVLSFYEIADYKIIFKTEKFRLKKNVCFKRKVKFT